VNATNSTPAPAPTAPRTVKRWRAPRLNLDTLRDLLPHGSGVDSDWTFEERKRGAVRCSNAWHRMSEHGYYSGWIPFGFTLRVVRDDSATAGPDGARIVVGPIRGAFKRPVAGCYTDDVPDMIGEELERIMREHVRELLAPELDGVDA
jgi:hypothetical protein